MHCIWVKKGLVHIVLWLRCCQDTAMCGCSAGLFAAYLIKELLFCLLLQVFNLLVSCQTPGPHLLIWSDDVTARRHPVMIMIRHMITGSAVNDGTASCTALTDMHA